MKHRKLFKKPALAAILVAGLALAGCAGSPEAPDDGDIELEFVTWQTEEAGIKDWWATVIDEFEEQNPGVTVTPRHVASGDIAEFLTNRFAAESAPQIIHLPTEVFPVFAEEGFLEPLDDRLAQTDILQNWPDAQSLMEWNGSMQGIMVFGYPVDLYVNTALLADAGVAVPTNASELVAAAQALTAGDIYGFGTVTTQHRDLFRQVTAHVVGFGGSWASGGSYNFDDPKVVAALENFREIARFSPEGVDSAQKRELFIQGKVAMMLDGPFIIPMINGASTDIASVAQVARAPFEFVSYWPANGLHIPSTVSDREKDLAWKFLELSASPSMQDLFVELYQSPASRAGAGSSVDTDPLLEQFLADAAESMGIIPDSRQVKAQFGVFDRHVQDGLMTMLTSDRAIADIFQEVEQKLLGAGIQP